MGTTQALVEAWARAGDLDLYDALNNPSELDPSALEVARAEFSRRGLPSDRAEYVQHSKARVKLSDETQAYLTAVPSTIWWYDLLGSLSFAYVVVLGLWELTYKRHEPAIIQWFVYGIAHTIFAWSLAAAMDRKQRWSRWVGILYALCLSPIFVGPTLIGLASLVRLCGRGANKWFSGETPAGVESPRAYSILNRIFSAITAR